MIDTLLYFVEAVLTMLPVFLIASVGELFSQRSGVFNVGIEGVMGLGGAIGVISYFLISTNLWICLLIGAMAGVVLGLLNSILSIRLKFSQIIVGFGIWFFGLGFGGFLNSALISGAPPTEKFDPILLDLDPIFYLSIVVWVLAYIILNKTGAGLKILAVGENARAADSAGINVDRARTICVLIGCGLIGLSGAYLFINFLQGFRTFVVGYGWMSLALVMASRWKSSNILPLALLFSAASVLGIRLQLEGVFLPTQFLNVVPHILVVVVLSISMYWGGRRVVPAELGVPYEKT